LQWVFAVTCLLLTGGCTTRPLPIYKFYTLKELVQFQSDYREALSLDKVLDKTPSFYQATSRYDRKFFKTARQYRFMQ